LLRRLFRRLTATALAWFAGLNLSILRIVD
jgi:hypothetical protein